LGILAHGLRTPLNAIGIGAEIMLRAEQLDSKYIKISSRIFGSAKRAGKIVENLLDFTRSHSSAGLSLRPEKANLKIVCEGIVEEVGIHHPDRKIIF
jgi:signal transduction histidine kinase